MSSNWIYIFLMAGTTFLIRVLPLTLLRKPITSRFIRSFLFYVPYVTLSVMTFPAIVEAANNPVSGIIALVSGIVAAWKKQSMFVVAILCCVVLFVCELILV